jgi:predicted DNA-binding ribbon-helix-helix protein
MTIAFTRRSGRHQDTGSSSLAIHNIVVGGHRTSVRLEPRMWDALQDISRQRQTTVHDLVTDIDRRRTASSLTAAIRVYIVDFYRAAARLGHPLAVPPMRLNLRRSEC